MDIGSKEAPLDAIARFVEGVDRLNQAVGRIAAWAVLGCVLLCFATAFLRYAFRWGSIGMQEGYVWLHGLVFMLGAGYALAHDRHVRVDVIYGRLAPKTRAAIDIACTLLLLFPWLAVLATGATGFILRSWRLFEASPEPGGLPGVFLLKTVIWLFCAFVGLQGAALIGRRLLLLAGRPEGDRSPAV